MKAGSAEYDALVARKMREREGTFKTIEGHTVGYKIAEDGKSAKITVPAEAALKVDNIPEHLRPKRRGRPPGVKNKPKVK